MEETYLAKVKSSDPEEFLFVTIDPAEGCIKRTTAPAGEAEVRGHLSSSGMLEAEIDQKLEHARKNPF
jgi:hypothetical protein